MGVDERTVIGGAELWFRCSEFLLEIGAEGGGDFTRGDRVPVEGVLSAFATVLEVDLGSLETASVTGPGWSCGTLVADKARWIAAAEGVLCVVVIGGLLGLVS